MTFQFWLGLILGCSATYIIKEVFDALNKKEGPHERLAKCTLEAIKLNAERDLADYTDQELIRAVTAGVQILPRRDDKPGGLHPKMRD